MTHINNLCLNLDTGSMIRLKIILKRLMHSKCTMVMHSLVLDVEFLVHFWNTFLQIFFFQSMLLD